MCGSESYCRISRRKFHPSLSEGSSHRKSRLAVWKTVVVVLMFQLVLPFFVFSSRISRLGFFVCPAYLFLNRLHIRIGVTNSRDLLSLLLLLVSSACCLLCASNVYTVQKGCQSNALQSHWDSDDSPSIQKAKQSKRPGYGIILSREGAIQLYPS